MGGPCTLNAMGWHISQICEVCGHHGAVHPGPNSIDACILCLLEAAILLMEEQRRAVPHVPLNCLVSAHGCCYAQPCVPRNVRCVTLLLFAP